MTAGVVLPDAPESVAGQRLFTVQHTDFTVADVVSRARPGNRDLVVPAGTAAQVQEAFRRARGLLTADQLTRWLAARAVTPEEFVAWAQAPTRSGTWTAFVCSGALEQAATEVAAAAAAACELGTPPTSAADFDPRGWTERLTAGATTVEALARVVQQHRLDWTSIRALGVLVPQRCAAEELRHWVLSDGLGLEIAATQAGAATYPVHGLLEEVSSAAVRSELAGARPGELVGPAPSGPGWVVLRLDARTEPDPQDPVVGAAVRARAAAAVRAAAVERAVLRHVAA